MDVIRNSGLTAVAIVLVFGAGCQKKEVPPVAYMGPTLTAQDLGGEPQACPPTGYVLLERSSRGRWPGAIAIAFVGRASQNSVQIATLTGEDGSWWNQLFTTVQQVREVIVMDELSLISPADDVDAIVERARLIRADVILMYGYAAAPAGHSALIGVIRDTDSGKPVAVVREQAGPGDYTAHPSTTTEQDMRHVDPDYIVQRRFEQQVRRCLLEIIRHDTAVPETQQSPWEKHERDRIERQTPIIIQPESPVRW